MVRPSALVVLPLMLAILLATANAQNFHTAPTPTPLPDSPCPSSSPPPPPPESSTAPPPASTPPPAASSSPPPPSPSPPSSSPPPPPPSPSSPPPASFSPPPNSPPPPPPPASNNWTPVANVNDPMIQKVAQFAVRIYAMIMREHKVKLQNVVSGETQPSSGGYNYRLVITVSGGKNTQYEAFVWGILGTTSWKLLSLTPKH